MTNDPAREPEGSVVYSMLNAGHCLEDKVLPSDLILSNAVSPLTNKSNRIELIHWEDENVAQWARGYFFGIKAKDLNDPENKPPGVEKWEIGQINTIFGNFNYVIVAYHSFNGKKRAMAVMLGKRVVPSCCDETRNFNYPITDVKPKVFHSSCAETETFDYPIREVKSRVRDYARNPFLSA